MAAVLAKEIPEVQAFFNELWFLYKKYYIPESNDDYWASAVSEFMKLQLKYPTVNVSKGMIQTILYDDLEIRYKKTSTNK